MSHDELVGQIIGKVNGTKVANMKHLAMLMTLVKESDTTESDTELTIDFHVPQGIKMREHLVFNVAELDKCEKEILESSKVQHWCSPELLE